MVVSNFSNIEFHFTNQLCRIGHGKRILDKYARSDMDCFRWSMKPVFIRYLLDRGFDQVFMLDCDICFFAPYEFLSKDLSGNSVLLTPHWRSSNPDIDRNNFSILLTSGLFNAGFVGVSQSGQKAMAWWAEACAYKCKKEPEEGLFVDQAYLNLLPIYFDDVAIERHRGCNVANWNQVECKRILSESGEVKINGEFEIVFIHFTSSTIRGITTGKDYLLKPYLETYRKSLEKHKSWISQSNRILPDSATGPETGNDQLVSPLKTESAGNDEFLNPEFSAVNLDLYIVRESILAALTAKVADFQGRLLDVGCGQKPYKALLTGSSSKVTHYIGLDLANNPIHDNQPDITWVNGNIPLDNDSIDCAVATEVFEHCPEPEVVMREVLRVLKPGGMLFCTVPFLWPLHEVPYDQYRYTPFSLKRHLANSGFTAIDLKPLGGWDASLAQMLGLWLRRRPLGKRMRWALSSLMLPVVYMLSRWDKRTTAQNQSSSMITGLSGTARKPGKSPGEQTERPISVAQRLK